VVPPGTQKVPDQAARISQSVTFVHLSDILGFLRGGRFLTLFLLIFDHFNFITFSLFTHFSFVTFLTFSIFSILTLFHVLSFLMIFMFFSCFDLFFDFEKGILKIRPSFDPFF